MEWLFKPKVLLGLLVNFAFVIFTLVSSSGERTALGRRRMPVVDTDSRTIPYAPPAATGKVTVLESDGRVSVFLTNDLTLVKKPDRTLVFAPSFSKGARPAEPPPTVTLRFTIFSGEEACPGACMLIINADGSHVWESAANGTFSTGWTREKVPASTISLADGQVAETLAAETFTTKIPYKTFLDIINSKRVVLSLGPDKVKLTREQIESLREMHRRVAAPHTEE
ncbi:MAG TPA: hypothetical protein VKB12_08290 [Pyrinomonadaceae bacterium]|nr:hypothetical protein [Pyrinomonadaceae bacterium]